MVMENTFGRLKGRWRCLLKQDDITTEDISTIITACCVLNNICEVHKNDFDDEWLEECADTLQVSGVPQYSINEVNVGPVIPVVTASLVATLYFFIILMKVLDFGLYLIFSSGGTKCSIASLHTLYNHR